MQNGKIAFVSNNNKNIVGAFGQSKYFEVFTIENGEVVARETREAYKTNAGNELPTLMNKVTADSPTSKPVFSLGVMDKSKEKHLKLAKTISDCNYVVARGMCANAWDSIEQFKMKPIITSQKDFDAVIPEVIAETIADNKHDINSKDD